MLKLCCILAHPLQNSSLSRAHRSNEYVRDRLSGQTVKSLAEREENYFMKGAPFQNRFIPSDHDFNCQYSVLLYLLSLWYLRNVVILKDIVLHFGGSITKLLNFHVSVV